MTRRDTACPVGSLSTLTVTTTLGGDNWNVDMLRISANGRVLYEADGTPLIRFTSANVPFVAPLHW